MAFFSNLNIGKRLGAGFSLTLAMVVLIAGVGISRLDHVATETADVLAQPLAKERMISEWHMQIFAVVRRTAAVVKSSDPSLGAYFKEDAAATAKRSSELMKDIEELIEPGEEKALWDRIVELRKTYSAARDGATKARADGDQELATRILNEQFTPAARAYQEGVQQLVQMQHAHISATASAIKSGAHASETLMMVLTGCAVALGALSSILLTRGIVRPIRDAVAVAETVASGDLSRSIEARSGDETGALLRALRHMNDSLVAIVSEVRSGTDTIATASSEISAGNLDLSSRTEQQAGSLEETAAAVEELTGTVRQNADNARQASQLSVTASEVAVQGGAVVSQVVQTMGAINESAKKIVDIISVIDGIAFQTNILALNAAVEAARAGEQGRGFAVVASEVRTLAQRSANAAKEIKELITASVDKVDSGTRLVDQAGATMEQVVGSIRRVTDIVADIASASAEQSAGIEQVNKAIGDMDATTQHNAALVEQSAAAAKALQEQASRLASTVSVFRLDGHGGGAVKPPKLAAAPVARLAHAGADWEAV
jgi:methyl-accepting chemotaxis protein